MNPTVNITENKRRGKAKKIAAAIAAVLIAAGAAAGIITGVRSSAESAGETSYREYSVSNGDITVGITESGTISIEREYVSFPCSAEVSEVYVKTGSYVNEGDPLLKLSAEDIAEAKAELETNLRSAELSLAQAEQEHDSKALQAEQTLTSSVNKGSTAQDEYQLYLTQNEASKESSRSQLEDLKEELEEYKAMELTYDGDYKILSDYEEKLEQYEQKYKEMESVYKGYQKTDSQNADAVESVQEEYNDYVDSVSSQVEKIKELKNAYEAAKEAYENAYSAYEQAQADYDEAEANASAISDTAQDNSSGSNSSSQTSASSASALKKLNETREAWVKARDEYNLAKLAYSGYYSNLDEKINDKIEEYEDRIAELEKTKKTHEKITSAYKSEMDDYNDEISAYREKYEDYKADFTEIYGANDKDSIEEKIKQLTSDISDAELKIQSSALSESSDILQAQQQAESAQSEAASAQTVYEQTIASLDNELESRKNEYEKLKEEYDEFCENTGSDGVIYAPCAGAVASVSVSEGDNIAANMNIVTLMDSRYVYLSTSVSEEDITALSVGQECSVSLTAYENKTFTGSIDTISAEPARSSGSVTYTVTVKLDDESGLNVLEGMTGEITFLEGQASGVLYTNVNAVSFRDGVSYVKMYDENGEITEKPVITGFSDGRYVEISEGVSAGDKVLAEIELSNGKD